MAKKTRALDFRSHYIEHCCICGKALPEDEVILDEHDGAWCSECLHEVCDRYQKLIEQIKKEKRQQ